MGQQNDSDRKLADFEKVLVLAYIAERGLPADPTLFCRLFDWTLDQANAALAYCQMGGMMAVRRVEAESSAEPVGEPADDILDADALEGVVD